MILYHNYRVLSIRQSPKILTVEDERRMCDVLKYLPKTMDYDVTTTSCGHDALVLIAENVLGLAVLGVHLPNRMGN